jgi:hypothetical protein
MPKGLGPKTLTGSRVAKRQAAVILEVLSGLRDARDGSTALGVSVNRYYQLETRALQGLIAYQLETRALQGLIAALEPRPKGRQQSPETRLAMVERERGRLKQELGRYQALLRSAQRSLGLASLPRKTKRGKLGGKDKPRRRRTVKRGLRAVAALRAEDVTPTPVSSTRPEPAKRGMSGS